MLKNRLYILFAFIFLLIIILVRSNSTRHPISVKQLSQLHSIEYGLELFKREFGCYPPSSSIDPNGIPYCGAMKLCEAMFGMDLLGFHPDSTFKHDGRGTDRSYLYNLSLLTPAEREINLKSRRYPYLPPEKYSAELIVNMYGAARSKPFSSQARIICDEYQHRYITGNKGGLPILYYRAHTDHSVHDINNPNNPENIYDYRDNHDLLALGVPWDSHTQHPMHNDPRIFYQMLTNPRTNKLVHSRVDTYVLISAGIDGLFGTKDDIFNFNRYEQE